MIILPLPAGSRLVREFHVKAEARRRYGVSERIVDLRGRVLVADPATAERLAASMNDVRQARRFPESGVSGAEILAAGLLDEAVHLFLDVYRRERDPSWLARLEERLEEDLGQRPLNAARRAFVAAFPTVEVAQGRLTADDWLQARGDELPHHHVVLEERLAVRLANENPALARVRELVHDDDLGKHDDELMARMERHLARAPGLPVASEGDEADLLSLLRAPFRAAPTSLEGQLAYVRRHWGSVLGPRLGGLLDRLVASLDLLAERRNRGAPGPPGPAPVPDRHALVGPGEEVEAFSPDAAWMPQVVLIAKNVYVWLGQISRTSGREVNRLDEVPDEALAELRSRGFNALWLIGLWQRSEASARIKRRRGQEDAVASAYALDDYRIADDLGGEEAWRSLRDRAERHGLRLASDMVPNHVGIDGRWVAEHPERFVQVPEPPYPGYRFTGPDLSGDGRMQVRIEDGYWDGSDAAVVFERIDAASGERRYLYHGNDGTSMPWNDTAQLDYLNPEVREAVIGVILDVARRFPIIRFDAAMTLAKRHVQRLWYPQPGHGGAIPSRSAHGALSDDEFHRRMPVEFWRDVVDRVAQEAPGTLLLAEAFWMMEGFFVRTLGMHRVYNSAFMNMMAREANDEYGQLMRNVLEFEPQILGRFVNFMNNPDEETAVQQFGDGDKAFGVTTVMATLPGLPMFGHGQVEGLREKYGMEYRRAKLDEAPNPHMVDRHRREIAPLLARRADFAGVERFRLFEVDGDDGPLHDVFAYANGRTGGPVHLVLYHNRYAEARGRIRWSVPYAGDGGGAERQGLAEALGIEGGADRFVRYRDHRSGLVHLVRSEAWRGDGMPVRLGAYECRVLMDLEEVRDVDGRLRRLYEHLDGRGARSLEDAFRDLELQPLHDAFAAILDAGEPAVRGASDGPSSQAASFATVLERTAPDLRFAPEVVTPLLRRAETLDAEEEGVPDRAWLRAWAVAIGFDRPADAAAGLRLEPVVARATGAAAGVDAATWGALWTEFLPASSATVRPTAETARADETAAPAEADEPAAPAEGRDVTAERSVARTAPAGDATAPADPSRAASRGGAPRADEASRPGPAASIAGALALLEASESLERILGVHEHDGVRWFRREPFRAWTSAWSGVYGLTGASLRERAEAATRWARLESASGYRYERLLAEADLAEEPVAGGSLASAAARPPVRGDDAPTPDTSEDDGEP